MSLTATARSIPGTLRQEVVIDGTHRLITDEPESVGGDGSAPAPHELFPAALASCVSTTLVMYARTKGWELGEVSVSVAYDNRATPRRFDVRIQLGGMLNSSEESGPTARRPGASGAAWRGAPLPGRCPRHAPPHDPQRARVSSCPPSPEPRSEAQGTAETLAQSSDSVQRCS
jgi:putative redox protein